MASYSVYIKPSAQKELEAAPLRQRRRLVELIGNLAATPRPPGALKLTGADSYRIRKGEYRIVYSISDRGRSVVVMKIGHRRDVYR